jgi:TPR repeat protein
VAKLAGTESTPRLPRTRKVCDVGSSGSAGLDYLGARAMNGLTAAVAIASVLLIAQAHAQQTPHWYYCDASKAYYPLVATCPVPWREVAPNPNAYGQVGSQQPESKAVPAPSALTVRYCDPAHAYYPLVATCPVPWREFVLNPNGTSQLSPAPASPGNALPAQAVGRAPNEVHNATSVGPAPTPAAPDAQAQNAATANDAATAAALKKAEAAMDHDNGTAYLILLGLANQGNARAEVDLGMMLSEGYSGIPEDYATAIKLYRKAAEQADAVGALKLAAMYKDGRGVPKDYAEAVAWYSKANDQGDPFTQSLARMLLAQIYEQGGYGVPQDYVQAYKWFDIVAAHKSSLGISDNGCPPDPSSGPACVAALDRDALAEKMTQPQINEAQRLARDWKPTPAQ